MSRPYSSFDLCDNWRLSRKMPGPEASVLGSARQQRVSARSGVGGGDYSGKLTAVRGAARAPPESSLLLVREPAKSTGEQDRGQ